MAKRESHAVVSRDPDAQADFRKRHGIINADIPVGNAEALIRAHSAAQSRAVQKASLLGINSKATAELDLDDISDQLGGDEVAAAAVRGNAIVVVAVDPSGRSYKTVLPANDRYVAPEEDALDAAQRAASDAELNFQAEVANLRQEHEAELEKVRQEQTQQLGEEIAKLREEFLGAQAKAAPSEKEVEESPTGGVGEADVPGGDGNPAGGPDAGLTGNANDPADGSGGKSRSSVSKPKQK